MNIFMSKGRKPAASQVTSINTIELLITVYVWDCSEVAKVVFVKCMATVSYRKMYKYSYISE
jgi:hypothetical protein